MNIQINKIIPFTCEAFDPQGKSLGHLNVYEFNDLRIQIKMNKVSGYYMMFEDYKIRIDKYGTCEAYPVGFYDLYTNQLFELLRGWN